MNTHNNHIQIPSSVLNDKSNSSEVKNFSKIRNSNSVFSEKQNPFNNLNHIKNSNSMQTDVPNPFNTLNAKPTQPSPPTPHQLPSTSLSLTSTTNHDQNRSTLLVLRPIFDLMNSSPSFTSSHGAINVLELHKIVPSFKTSGIKFLDVVSDSERNVLLMLGSQNNVDVGWNNVGFVQLKGKPKIVFRFYGFALKKIQRISIQCH